MDDETGLKRIKAAKYYLLKEVDVIHDGVADDLYGKELLTDEEYEKVTMKGETTQEHMRKLLGILLKNKIVGTYAIFTQTLRACSNRYVADKLDEYDVTDVVIGDEDTFDEVDSKVIKTFGAKLDKMHAEMAEMNTMVVQLCNKIEEDGGKKPAEDPHRATMQEASAKLRSVMGEGFANMLLNSQCTNSKTGIIGHGTSTANFVFPNIQHLSSTWESLTACRLSVDAVRYLANKGDPQIQPIKPFSNLAVSMRRMIDEIVGEKNFQDVLEKAMLSVNLSDIEGYKMFTVIRNGMFISETDRKWSSILVWFAFCAYFARGFPKWTKPEELDVHGIHCWYLIDQLLAPGQWDEFLHFVESQSDAAESARKRQSGFSLFSRLRSYLS